MKNAARIVRFAALPFAIGGLLLTSPAFAYPTKPITLVVPFSPGSATDVIARVLGEQMSQYLGQSVIVENRPGAGGTVGSSLVAKAAPDGYTLLVNSNAHAANPALYNKLPYDTLTDFTGVTTLASLPNVLITASASNYKSVPDLVAQAKKQPGKLNFASAGAGSATHINAEKFASKAGIEAVHIPFNGTPPAVTQTIANEVDFMFAPIVSVLPQIQSGNLRALAVGSEKRSQLLPDTPTTVEAGVAGSDFNFWIALLAPGKTPPDVVDKLYAAVNQAVQTEAVKKRYAALGAEPSLLPPADFNRYIQQQTTELGELIRSAGVKLDN
ncbi:MAG: tripartite tricarboxylate transporter substrate binding protein [Pigmentiphaga sp.]